MENENKNEGENHSSRETEREEMMGKKHTKQNEFFYMSIKNNFYKQKSVAFYLVPNFFFVAVHGAFGWVHFTM